MPEVEERKRGGFLFQHQLWFYTSIQTHFGMELLRNSHIEYVLWTSNYFVDVLRYFIIAISLEHATRSMELFHLLQNNFTSNYWFYFKLLILRNMNFLPSSPWGLYWQKLSHRSSISAIGTIICVRLVAHRTCNEFSSTFTSNFMYKFDHIPCTVSK